MRRRLRLCLIFTFCLGFQAWGGASAAPWQFRAMADPRSHLVTPEAQYPKSGLPSGWKWHPITPRGEFPTGESNVAVSLDPITGTISESYREGDVEVREPLVITPTEYNELLTGRNVRRLWNEKTKQTRSVARGQQRSAGIFRVELPVQLPKIVRSIVGDGTPNIEVSGSETITISGTRDWTVTERVETENQQAGGFPSLEMKQDLNVNLTGSIGDRIKVDVDQSSNVQTSIDNKVKLRYEGDEDDMIRSVELGNTNLSVEGASFRQEGLFGIKTVAKLGNVDLIAIASKQEGKTETARFTPSGENKQVRLEDLNYIRRTYFLIADQPVNIVRGSITVYKDDKTGISSGGVLPGLARLDPTALPDTLDPAVNDTIATNPQKYGNFKVLEAGVDYQLINPWLVSGTTGLEIPVIKLTLALQPYEVLAVTFQDATTGAVGTLTQTDFAAEDLALGKPANTYLMKMIKPTLDDFTVHPTNGLLDPAGQWYPALFYELRNFYDLLGRDIVLSTLTLTVRRIDAGQATNPEVAADDSTALIRVLGLDQRSLPGAADENVPDGKLDNNYIDPVTGILFFPDLHPFAPDMTNPLGLCDSLGGFGGFNCLDDFGRNRLRDAGADPANLAVYYSKSPNPFTDTRYVIEAEFKSSQQGFFLGRFDILENSEQVKVDGIPQQRGLDYNIDYLTGQLSFIKPPGPESTISVDFSFAPGFGSTQLTLLGGSASYVPGPNLSITSSVLYDKRGAAETNPKLGEEPAESVIGDLASVVTFRPVWMTGLANVIPGVRTSSPSTLNIQGHAALSVPNPNTAGEAYIDDMEGNRESNTASLTRTQWFWSSTPVTDTGDSLRPVPETVVDHARASWFNPPNDDYAGNTKVQEGDLKPVLSNAEGGDSPRTVLEVNFQPPPGQASLIPQHWAGVTQSLGTVGQDFSKLRYLEIWINDFTQDHTTTQGKLHINFGRISEDAFWDPNAIPNRLLDTEDKNGDGRLDSKEGDLSVDEDTGLDGLDDTEELGYAGAGSDPNGDNYAYDRDNAPADYSRINNTEDNDRGTAGARPDTEDLNRDNYPDFQNEYFEATVDLSGTTYVAIDVARDYAGDPNVEHTVKANNGWRLFRIPLNDAAFQRVNAASWENIQHIRLWMNGMTNPLKIQVGGIELVGNRWLTQAIPEAVTQRGVFLAVGVRNNKDDADIYTSPYDVENAVGGTATRREQSLALNYSGLVSGDSVLAFKTSAIDPGGQGWTQYQQVRFWVHGEPTALAQNLRAVARFGADTVNYYEYSVPVPNGWQNVVIPMELLSRIKETGGTERVKVDSLTGAATQEVYTVVGNPSFTRIFRMSFGLTIHGATPTTNAGEVWFNDLRLSNVIKDQGLRADVSVQANFADVVSMNVSYEYQDENFVRVGSGVSRGTGVNHTAASFSSTFQLDRMFPTTGIQVPVRFSMSRARDVPKFRTGSDVILGGDRSELETRKQDRQGIDLSYRRAAPRKGIAKYTIDALSGAAAYTRSGTINTNSVDSSWNFTASTSYDLPVGGGGFGLGSKMKINILPEVIGVSTTWFSSRDVAYGRALLQQGDSIGLRSDVKARVLTLNGNSSWVPLSSVRFRFGITSIRNMLLRQEGYFGFNKGTEVDQRRNFELNYTPRWFALLTPNVTLIGRYHESSRPELRTLAGDPAGLMSIDNGGTARATATLPLGRFAQKLAPRPGSKSPTGADAVLAPVRLFISRLQDVQGTFGFERVTVISRVEGDPGFMFKTGFTSTVSPELTRLNNSVFTESRTYTTGANTSFRPTANLTIDARADHRLTLTDANLGERRQLSITLPDLKARWLELHRVLGLSNSISSMSFNSGWNFRRDEIGPQNGPIEQILETTNWQPLIGWDLAWRNGLRANISTNVIQATNLDERLLGTVGDRQTVNTEIRFTKVYQASRGIKFPWSKTRVKLRNDLNLNLNIQLGSDRKVTKRPPPFQDIVELDNQRLNVTSSTAYNFTQQISGGFNLGFRQTKDLKSEITTRGITIALNGQFRF